MSQFEEAFQDTLKWETSAKTVTVLKTMLSFDRKNVMFANAGQLPRTATLISRLPGGAARLKVHGYQGTWYAHPGSWKDGL